MIKYGRKELEMHEKLQGNCMASDDPIACVLSCLPKKGLGRKVFFIC